MIGGFQQMGNAGLTIATQACKRIEQEGQPAVNDWKKVLAAGNTLDPIGLAGLAMCHQQFIHGGRGFHEIGGNIRSEDGLAAAF